MLPHIKMSPEDFMKEHRRLLSVLHHPTAKRLSEEAARQAKEVKDVMKRWKGK